MDELVRRYLELYARYGHASRRPGDRPQFDLAQRELWALAQAICQLAHPQIQAELEAARRDAIAQIRLHIQHATPVSVCSRPYHRPISWPDFQLTPELSMDPTTIGACVTVDVAKRLKEAHKHQVSAVFQIIHRYR